MYWGTKEIKRKIDKLYRDTLWLKNQLENREKKNKNMIMETLPYKERTYLIAHRNVREWMGD